MSLSDEIKSCQTLDSLNFYVLTNVWVNNLELLNAILDRYVELDPGANHRFGTSDFWKATEQAIDGTFESQSESEPEPWMLQDQYHQSGGKAPLADMEEPNMDDLYEITAIENRSYKRYCSGRVGCTIRFKDTDKMDDFYSLAPKVWDDVLKRGFSSADPKTKIGVTISHPSLDSDIEIPMTERDNLNGDMIAQNDHQGAAIEERSEVRRRYESHLHSFEVSSRTRIQTRLPRNCFEPERKPYWSRWQLHSYQEQRRYLLRQGYCNS